MTLRFMSIFAPLMRIRRLLCHTALNSFCAGAADSAADRVAANTRAAVLV